MSEKPEALRLADWCDTHNTVQHDKAAAELRRLRAENEDLRRCAEVGEVEKYAAANRHLRLYALNWELLEALKVLCESHQRFSGGVWDKARAAIAKAEGQA
jgi:hypothetical protein